MRGTFRAIVIGAALCAATPQTGLAGAAGACPLARLTEGLDAFAITGKMAPDVSEALFDPAAQRVAPFKAFDNVYFVGVCWVSAWLITDPAGDILIDTLHEPHLDTLLANLAAVGAKPADIRYVLITHGHFDHAAGAARLKPLLANARFVMTRTGWDEAIASAKASSPRPWEMIAPDIVAKDGDVLTVGQTAITVYETPGHTFGTASYGYTVRDGATAYRAITVGGLGLNAIKNAAQVEAYIASVKRLQGMVDAAQDPITVSLTTHPPAAGMFAQADQLAARPPGAANPFVDRAAFQRQLAQLRQNGEARLAVEIEKANAAKK